MTQSDDSPSDTQDDSHAQSDDDTQDDSHAQSVEYLEHEVNLFRPSTPFMRDNLKMIFLLFATWCVFIFGPVTASLFAEDFMTETTVLGGFPLNFFLTAIVAPLAALVLAAVYAWYRDRLDEKYGVVHETTAEVGQAATANRGQAEGGEAP